MRERVAIHPTIDESDLQSNRKLLTDRQIDSLKNKYKEAADKTLFYRRAKHAINKDQIKFSVFFYNDTPYAVYYGDMKNKSLGRGSMGKIKLIQNLESGEWSALKINRVQFGYGVEDINDIRKQIFSNEARIQGLLHENIKDKKEIIIRVSEKKGASHEFIMHLIPGVNLKSATITDDLQLLIILKKMAEQLQYVHQKGVAHRDIKPDNFMYDAKTDKVTLIDFGFSVDKDSPRFLHEIKCGPEDYIAPDLAKLDSFEDVSLDDFFKADIYSLAASFEDIVDHMNPNEVSKILLKFIYGDMENLDLSLRSNLGEVIKRLDSIIQLKQLQFSTPEILETSEKLPQSKQSALNELINYLNGDEFTRDDFAVKYSKALNATMTSFNLKRSAYFGIGSLFAHPSMHMDVLVNAFNHFPTDMKTKIFEGLDPLAQAYVRPLVGLTHQKHELK